MRRNIVERPGGVKTDSLKILSPPPFPNPGRICIMRGPPDGSIDRRDAQNAAVSIRVDESKTGGKMRGPAGGEMV